MSDKNRNDNALFDALLKSAATDALSEEAAALPSPGELNDTYSPSPNLDRRVQRMISRSKARARTCRWAKRAGKAAACVIIAVSASIGVLMSIEATRLVILNTLIEWQEEYASFTFGTDDDSDSNSDNGSGDDTVSGEYMPEYMPEGFTIEETYQGNSFLILTYIDANGIQITFDQSKPSNSMMSNVNNENVDYIELDINGYDAYLFQAQNDNVENTLIWFIDDAMLILTSPIDTSELIKIAESVTKIN